MGKKSRNKKISKDPTLSEDTVVVSAKSVSTKKKSDTSFLDFRSQDTRIGILFSILAFILYSNTIGHDFALDDGLVINQNLVTQKGFAGIPEIFSNHFLAGNQSHQSGLYRPLTLTMFAIEWQISPNNPLIHHFVSVLFYTLTAFFLYKLTRRIFRGYSVIYPFLATLLFVVHPIHTEVVANIKSRDELMAFFFMVLSMIKVFKYLDTGDRKQLWITAIFYFAALLFKESSVTLFPILLLIPFFFSESEQARKKWIPVIVFTGAALLLQLSIRSMVLAGGKGEIGFEVINNTLYGVDSWSVKSATIVMLMGRYLLLLFFPHPLSSDYSYNQIPLADWSFLEPWIALVAYLAIAVLILTRFRKREIMVFGLLFFLLTISLYSNIFFLVGSTLGERFLYTPSYGFCLFVVGGLSILLKNKGVKFSDDLLSTFKKSGLVPYLFLGVCLLFSFKTWSRNQDWTNNLSLWGRDVEVVPYNARMHYWYGNEVMIRLANPETDPVLKQKFYDTALSHLNRAIQILPDYHDALLGRGMYYYRQRQMEQAEADFRLAISNGKGSWSVMNNLGVIYAERNQLDSSYKFFKLAYQLGPQEAAVNKSLGDYYSVTNKVDSALLHYQKAIENVEADEQKLLPEIYGYMEELYRFKGDSVNALRYRLLLQERNRN